MSGQLAIAEPRRIKASHRRRRKVTAGPIVQRYYDPQIGRSLSSDPAQSEFNRYSYAGNNPYRFIDPDGREKQEPKPDCGGNSDCIAAQGQAERERREQRQRELRTKSDQFAGATGSSNWEHAYGGEGSGDWAVCSAGQEWCNRSNGFDALRHFAFPGQDNAQPVADGQISEVSFLGVPGGHIQTRVDEKSFSVTNVTRPDHVLRWGSVTRSMVWSGGTLYLRTSGHGTNTNAATWALNYLVWRPGFNQTNDNLRFVMIQQWLKTQ